MTENPWTAESHSVVVNGAGEPLGVLWPRLDPWRRDQWRVRLPLEADVHVNAQRFLEHRALAAGLDDDIVELEFLRGNLLRLVDGDIDRYRHYLPVTTLPLPDPRLLCRLKLFQEACLLDLLIDRLAEELGCPRPVN